MATPTPDYTAWSRRAEAARQAGLALTHRVQSRRHALESIFAEHRVGEAYLFGSVARGEGRHGSDIDIAVAGCPPTVFYRLAARLERSLDLPLDLVDLDRAPADFAQPIRQHGVRLYPPGSAAEQCPLAERSTPVTRAELRVLRTQLLAERARLDAIASQLKALEASLGPREPSVVELMAAGGFLHNVYNGIENCLSRLAHGIDESVPSCNESHRLLLDQLSEPIAELRPALLSRELAARIDDYRRFRHAFRHMYFFDLEWTRLRPLAAGVPALLADFDRAIEALFAQLGA